MHIRSRAAATTALLLTASVSGLAAIGASAQATTHTHTHIAGRAAAGPVITIKSKAHALKLSDDKIRPGNTVFRVKNIDGSKSNGPIQLLRLRRGYTLADAFSDIPQAFGGDTAAVKRVDDNVVFLGGMNASGPRTRPAQQWAVHLRKTGTYYLINFNTQNLVTFTVRGPEQHHALPSQDGFINPKSSHNAAGNTFKAGKHNPVSGWMSTRNRAPEPHFVDIQQVKKGTTNADITGLFHGGPNPFVKNGAKASTGVISPGHRFLWAYNLKKAKYAVFCFWPSVMTGQPHAIMGMHIVTHLG
jgi:hypothetical protein